MAISLSPEQQKAIEEQKANCPFCKIVKGDIPAKKVYEDDQVQAILDINPAAKGHLLVMPKEHYPIMPLIADKTFEHLASITRELCLAEHDGLLVPGSTVFIANGAAAGQQSQHFLLHIIPREENDVLRMLTPPEKSIENKEKIQKLHTDLRNNFGIMMRNHLKRMGKPLPPETSPEKLVALIEANPPLLELALNKPEEFKQMAQKHPQLSPLFKGKNIDEILALLQKKHEKKEKSGKPVLSTEKEQNETNHDNSHHDMGNDNKNAEDDGEDKVSLDDIARLVGGK